MEKKVLIIDDDPAILEVIKLILEENGYQALISQNGKIIDNMDGLNPDLILLDVLISGTDGREISKKLKNNKQTNKIPIVMISAHPSAGQDYKKYGADYFLPKPFDVDILLSTINNFIGK